MADRHRRNLATAHSTLMFLALIALASLAYSWPERRATGTAVWLATPALCLQTAVLLYLASTAILELNIAQALRSGQSARAGLGLPTLLGHLWVLLVAAATAWRGAASRTYLAGLDWQLATLMVASLLALLLMASTRRLKDQADASTSPSSSDRQLRGLSWLHAGISLAVVVALWYLETRPLEVTR
jgi:hypothetical protein